MEFSVELGLESNSDRAPPKQLPSLRFKTVHKNKKMVGSPSVMQPKVCEKAWMSVLKLRKLHLVKSRPKIHVNYKTAIPI